jgi:hypothetical protein
LQLISPSRCNRISPSRCNQPQPLQGRCKRISPSRWHDRATVGCRCTSNGGTLLCADPGGTCTCDEGCVNPDGPRWLRGKPQPCRYARPLRPLPICAAVTAGTG